MATKILQYTVENMQVATKDELYISIVYGNSHYWNNDNTNDNANDNGDLDGLGLRVVVRSRSTSVCPCNML